jgi:hypothetical protein
MTAAVLLSAYHKGRFQFRVCRVDGTSPQEEREQLTDACLDQHILVSAGRPRLQASLAGALLQGYFAGPLAGPSCRPRLLTCTRVGTCLAAQPSWYGGCHTKQATLHNIT